MPAQATDASAKPDQGLGEALRRLTGASAIYGLGSILMRGLNLLLLPLYTRYLSKGDYGIVSLCATIMAILGVVYPLGLQGALTRVYYSARDLEDRRARSGTIWSTILLFAGAVALVINQTGPILAGWLVPDVPFHPYIRLALWTAYFATFSLVPLVLLQIKERPFAYVLTSTGTSLFTAAAVVGGVVGLRMGAYGYLLGGLIGAMAGAVPYTWLALRNVTPGLRWSLLQPALRYGLPLVPHALATWILELSDRVLLARFASMADVGVYSVGYQLGSAMSLPIAAFTAAWVPFLFKSAATDGSAADHRLARLATYYAAVLCSIALGWALVVRHAIGIIAAPAFHDAARVSPWVIAGYVFNGLYILPIGLLFWRERTSLIPLVTLVAGTVNVAMNLLLLPRFGMIAAAWSTCVAYGVMLCLAWRAGRQVYAFPYEHRRLATIVLLALALYGTATVISLPDPRLEMASQAALWLLYPVGLFLLGTFEPSEVAAVFAFFQGRKREKRSTAG